VEVGQEAFRAGVHPVDEGEAAFVVALDILQPATKFELFVADGVEGGLRFDRLAIGAEHFDARVRGGTRCAAMSR